MALWESFSFLKNWTCNCDRTLKSRSWALPQGNKDLGLPETCTRMCGAVIHSGPNWKPPRGSLRWVLMKRTAPLTPRGPPGHREAGWVSREGCGVKQPGPKLQTVWFCLHGVLEMAKLESAPRSVAARDQARDPAGMEQGLPWLWSC